MKVWIVTSGCYSNYRIQAVFSSETAAKDAARSFDDGDAKEFEVDGDSIPIVPDGMRQFFVSMNHRGDEAYADTTDYHPTSCYGRFDRTKFYADVIARDEKHAIKIANEIRTRMIAEGKLG